MLNRRFVVMALAPLALALVALAVIGGSHTEARQTPPPPAQAALVNQVQGCSSDAGASQECGYPVYECFWIVKYDGVGGTPGAPVQLYTESYGEDNAIVSRLAWLCESGYKYRFTDLGPNGVDVDVQGQRTKVYACYYIANGDTVFQWETVNTNNFGADRVFVVKSGIMCENAKKLHNESTTGSLDDEAEAEGNYTSIWQCFNLNALPRLRPFGIWTNNFNWQSIWAMNGYQLCEDASKVHNEKEYGRADGDLRECFRIEQMNPVWVNQWVTLTTKNFGSVNALVGRPMMMCEKAWSPKDPA